MDPITIGAAVAGLIAKALGRAEDGVVDSAVKVAKGALAKLRQHFAGDTEVEKALAEVEKRPKSGGREMVLAEILESRAADSPGVLEELKSILAEAKAAGVTIGPIKQIAVGTDIDQVSGLVNSTVTINKGTRPPAGD